MQRKKNKIFLFLFWACVLLWLSFPQISKNLWTRGDLRVNLTHHVQGQTQTSSFQFDWSHLRFGSEPWDTSGKPLSPRQAGVHNLRNSKHGSRLPFFLPLLPAIHLLSVSVGLHTPSSAPKWNPVTCSLLSVAYFPEHHVFKVHSCAGMSTSFLLHLNDTLLMNRMFGLILGSVMNNAVSTCVQVSVGHVFLVLLGIKRKK